jgi:hypothetical protein
MLIEFFISDRNTAALQLRYPQGMAVQGNVSAEEQE